MNNYQNKRIGITFCTFDTYQAKWMRTFKEAKKVCDYLIVCLHVDPSIEKPTKRKPIQSVQERYLLLRDISHIDKIIPYETEADIIEILKIMRPDVRIIGAKWKGRKYTGYELEIPVYFTR